MDTTELPGNVSSFSLCSQPTNGTAQLVQNQCLVFTPAAGFIGQDTFCVVICNNTEDCDTSIVVVTVAPVQPPVVTKDTVNLTLVENTVSTPFCLDLSQLPGPLTSLDFCTPPANGDITPSGGNCFIYTPNPDFVGSDAACILFCSGAVCDTTIILVTVAPAPGPTVDTVFATIAQDSIFMFCLDSSQLNTGIEGIAVCGSPSAGQISLLTPPCFQYQPNPSFLGEVDFCMVACDSTGVCDTTIFVITVVKDSTPPPPAPDSLYLATDVNTPITGCADLSMLSGGLDFIGLCSDPANGQVGFQPGNPCFNYTPAQDFVGLDSFCVVACNGSGVCDTTFVWVLVNTPTDTTGNYNSSIDTVYVSTPQDSTIGSICFNWDNLTGPPSTIGFCGLAVNGSIDFLASLCVTYSPVTGFVGIDQFCVSACDSTGNCDTTIVVVLVYPPSPPAGPEIDTIHVDVPFETPSQLVCLDLSEIGGSATSLSFCGLPVNGDLVQNSGFCLIYTPDSAFIGNDTACVVVCNGTVCDTTILVFTVSPPTSVDCGILPVGPLEIFVDTGDSATLCLNLPLDQVPLYQFLDNGLPYSTGFAGCNFDSMLAYTYFTVPGLRAVGPYNLDKWTVDGVVFSGNFPNIKALVDSMNVWDAGCNWFLDPTTLTIRGGCFGKNYGNMQVTQLSTLGVAVIELNLFLNPMGSQIFLLPGEHEIVVNGPGCSDTLLVNVLINPQIQIDTVVFVGNTDTICLSDYGFTDIDSVFVDLCPTQNGTNVDFQFDSLTNCLIYTGQSVGVDTFCLQVCENDTCTLISVFVTSIQPVPCADFLGTDSLTLNSQTCDTANVIACTNLAFLMAQNYLVLDNNKPVGLTKCPPDQNGIQNVGVILTSIGEHEIIFNNPVNGCRDTLNVSVLCPKPVADLVDTVFVGQTDSTCFGGNGVASIENICPDLSGQLVSFTIDTTNFCVIYTGLAVGTETACIVVCDSLGVCDTVNLAVTVIPQDTSSNNKPPVAVDDLVNTSTNQTVTITVLDNDTLNGPLTSLKILQQPPHGIAIMQGVTIVYKPNQDYCDSQTPDSLLYEICNPYGCDTAWVYILVKCKEIVIYNGLSPNDDGMNDVFQIDGVDLFPDNDLTVFNRWGNEVYKTKGYKSDWHGTFEGKTLPDGVYFYIFHDGLGREWSGHLVIFR